MNTDWKIISQTFGKIQIFRIISRRFVEVMGCSNQLCTTNQIAAVRYRRGKKFQIPDCSSSRLQIADCRFFEFQITVPKSKLLQITDYMSSKLQVPDFRLQFKIAGSRLQITNYSSKFQIIADYRL
ncbi:uncharacterized protein [Solanum tuberosum]|uniref:uncharacterized protein n=1 Tax=Solanum tuberosum TaxID=4113 RepID=UPI00073A336E|nr:PREDICTED: uncharacterized protein LOC107058455 [Solanum tuberosum]XP_015159657.1 PREDICTED: uncharacterized protein LOC107058455 [Solanum tuberosum]XP_015159659.1 PREDICTED: uncharacterized protein LOC107058455 [Solanum tuberosum]XP_015159660.1 PREDICTED: uncharacterized protein LOC107058455 [Solanum tuberosum]